MNDIDEKAKLEGTREEGIIPDDAEMRKINKIANKMASKGHRREQSEESATNVGGVSGESGGIFSK